MKIRLTLTLICIYFATIGLCQEKLLYWTDGAAPGIFRSNLDGENLELIISEDLENPYDIIVDDINQKIYWSDRGTDKIEQSDLDGSNRVSLDVGVLDEPRGLSIDNVNQKLYWVDFGTQRIQRSNLDGSNVETIISTDIQEPHGIFIDAINQHIYFTDRAAETVERADLDGGNRIRLVSSGLDNPAAIEVDITNNKIYWSDSKTDRIQCSDLLGGSVQTIVSNLSTPFRIRLESDDNKIYWTDLDRYTIERSNVDGSNIETVHQFNSKSRPAGLFLYQPVIVEEAQTCKVQVIHNGNHETIGVYANGEEVVDFLAYLTATEYIEFPAGFDIELELRSRRPYQPAGSVFKNVTLDPNKNYILCIYGSFDPNDNYPVEIQWVDNADPVVADGIVDIQYFHGGYDAEEVDILLDNQPLFPAMIYGDFNNDFISLPASRGQRIDILDVDRNRIIGSYKLDIDWWKGNSLTIFGTGFIDKGNFYPHVALSNGGTFALPLWDGPNFADESDKEIEFKTNYPYENSSLLVEISPNPANSIINVEVSTNLEKNLNLFISNSVGEIIYSIEFDEKAVKPFQIDITNLPAGLYYMSTCANRNICNNTKFIKIN